MGTPHVSLHIGEPSPTGTNHCLNILWRFTTIALCIYGDGYLFLGKRISVEIFICWWYHLNFRWEPEHASSEPVPKGAGLGLQKRRQLCHRRIDGDARRIPLLAGRAAASVSLLQNQIFRAPPQRFVAHDAHTLIKSCFVESCFWIMNW